MVYLWLRRVHLALTLVAGIFILSMCVSGLLLVYATDIQKIMWPNEWTVDTPVDVSEAETPVLAHKIESGSYSIDAVVERAQAQAQSRITLLNLQVEPDDIWQVGLANGKYANVNPYTGDVLKQYYYDDTFYGFLLSWHRRLLQSGDSATVSQNVLSTAATILCINLLVGLALWAKPKRRLKRMLYRPTNNAKSKIGQIHALLGVYTFIPLFLISLSGIAFFWVAPTKALVQAFTFGSVALPQHPQAETVGAPNLAQILASSSSVFAHGEPRRIYFAKKAGDPIKVRVQLPTENHPYSWVWLEPEDSRVIDSFNAEAQNLATKTWNFRYKFHVGQWWNGVIQCLWLLLMFVPIFWVVSGVWLALKRRRKPAR